MTVNSRDFQRDFAKMKAMAVRGEAIKVVSGGQEFVFQSVKPRAWRGALKGKINIKGDILTTDVDWESSR